MADNNIALRFTEETYATRAEVAKALNTNLIDGFWNNILMYRRQYMRATSLTDISKARYQITFSPSIIEKCNIIEQKLLQFEEAVNKYDASSYERINIISRQKKSILYSVAKTLGISLNDVALNNILNGREVDSYYAPLVSYYRALAFISNHQEYDTDEDLLAKLYTILNGDGELTSFYRMSEFQVHAQKVVINREYMGAPVRLIEELMESLVDFIEDEDNLPSLKLGAIYYMMDYIKPFEQYNELMSSLLAKYILVKAGFLNSEYLNIESLFAESYDKFRIYSKEVQKTRDLTYTLVMVLDEAIKDISDAINMINRLEINAARDEYYMGDSKEEFKQEFGVDMPVHEETISAPVYEVPTPSFDEYLPKEEAKEEKVEIIPEVKKEPIVEKVKPVKKEPTVMAKAIVSEDKNFKQMEEDMLESDPELRPHQAHFYVRHNTLGKFYTIQLYKKCEGVVYETARTSMDNLAKKGYYKREQVKNKFVYTPVKLD